MFPQLSYYETALFMSDLQSSQLPVTNSNLSPAQYLDSILSYSREILRRNSFRMKCSSYLILLSFLESFPDNGLFSGPALLVSACLAVVPQVKFFVKECAPAQREPVAQRIL